MKKNVSDAAMGVFGSGWAWVCLAPDGQLITVTTANQDNPLMGTEVSGAPACTPIFGIDVWEHA
jgi:Fe-Mn family superoxide dismutase